MRRPAHLVSVLLLLHLCACDAEKIADDVDPPDDTAALTLPPDVIDMGQIVYGEQASNIRFTPGEKHGYLLVGRRDNFVGINTRMFGASGGITHTLALFGPAGPDGTFPTTALATAVSSFPNINKALPATGTYLITQVIGGPGADLQASVSVSCSQSTCRPNTTSPMSFGRSRITQAAIERGRYSANQLFDVGDFLFEHAFEASEGWGNGLGAQSPGGGGSAPNLRRIHKGRFGGPDSQTCDRCHLAGGRDGAGDNTVNMFQDGDGLSPQSALVRNARQVIGVGYLELLGREMTADLQAQRNAGLAAAQASGQTQTVALASKGVGFGSIRVAPDGSVDTTSILGIDADLVVKPFGWKGREASLARFVEGGFQVHLGMQSERLVAAHCATPAPDAVGTGPDCHDPDADGVTRELTDGQITAMAVYTAMQQAPVRLEPPLERQARVRSGELLFHQIGCASCHVPTLVLNDATLFSLTPPPNVLPLVFDLALIGKPPALTYDGDGVVPVELFSDLKRHDMGPLLADTHPTFGTIAANVFMTPPLWGLASSSPYLHDGRTGSSGNLRFDLRAAIQAHGGEAAAARAAYNELPDRSLAPNDQQEWVIDFLLTLGRDPAHLDD